MYELIEELNEKIKNCNICNLSKTRKNVILGNSKNQNEAEIMVIGNDPNQDDEVNEKAFSGNQGILLKFAFQTLGIDENKIYYTNVLKCRLFNNDGIEESKKCINYLRNEVLILKPKVVILLGDKVIKSILGSEFNIKSGKGILIEKKDIKYLPTYSLMDIYMNENLKIDFLKSLEKIK